ncbi:neutral zinc metallopeptidase [Octadecabacter antarcticus]|nr:neutral zinc metallopeptidase [Octadecabacter antarcticus]
MTWQGRRRRRNIEDRRSANVGVLWDAGRTIQPHTITHATSEQCQRWFRTGYGAAQITACNNTFETNKL